MSKTTPKSDNVISHEIFQKPRQIEDRGIGSYLTLRNVVIGLGVSTFLIFLGSAVAPRIAFLFAALLGLTGLVLYEMSTRRRWEKNIIRQMQKMSDDYDRIVREAARNRNDLITLKKSLADTGSLARGYSKNMDDATVEHRMLKAIANQLSRIGESAPVTEEDLSPIDIGVVEKDAPVGEKSDVGIGLRLRDEQVMQLVNLAVKQDRIDLFTQPIVNLPQRKLRFFETFSRIRIKKDVYLPAERYIELALERDLVPVIDNLLLLRSLQIVRDTEEENFNRAFFCNITSLTLNDPKFMGDLVEFISQHRTMAPRLVFELSQQDLATMSPDILPVLSGLGHLGCRFSMDQVKALSFDFAHLETRHIRFVKIDAALMLAEMKQPGGLQRVKRLKSEMDRHGIDLIAEKVETERQLLELLDVEIDYGQGYLFGKPALYENPAVNA